MKIRYIEISDKMNHDKKQIPIQFGSPEREMRVQKMSTLCGTAGAEVFVIVYIVAPNFFSIFQYSNNLAVVNFFVAVRTEETASFES